MKITIQYLLIPETTENQAYSIDFNLPEVNIPQTSHDWKGLVQERFHFPNTMTIRQMKVDRRDSNQIKISATFTLNNLLNSLPNEILLPITQNLLVKPYIQLRNQVSTEQTHRIASIEAKHSGIAIFKQSPGAWIRLENVNAVVESLKNVQTIKQLLTLVDGWIQTEDGVKKFYLWMDKFGECFANMYNQLTSKPADLKQAHKALYHLMTKHQARDEIGVNEKELATIATDATIIEKYPAVANSLTTTALFLKDNTTTSYQDWLKSKGVLYWNLTGEYLSGSSLRWAYLTGANLTGANLTGANLTGAHLSGSCLREAYLTGANLAGAELVAADLIGANLAGAHLRGADLTGAYLRGACLIEADLTGADLIRADLEKANLIGVDLIGAGLTEADLTGASLTGADLAETHFYGAQLTNVIWSAECLSSAKISRWKTTEADIKNAEARDLGQIYQDSICQGNLWDIQKNPTWDKFCSFFKRTPIQTKHRRMLNHALYQKARELMKTTDKTDPTFTVLEELINKVSPS